MAKVVFIQNTWAEIFGPMCLVALLRDKGHFAEIVVEAGRIKRLVREVATLSPDIVCFYCTTGMHLWALNRANHIKQSREDILIAIGGPHPTLAPDIVKDPSVDVVCRGEGEEAVIELADAIDSDKFRFRTDISNLWIKRDRHIHKNHLRPLIQDLDTLPFPDRSYYKRYNHFKTMGARSFIAGRGCPFKCNYCINENLMDLYRGKGKFVRYRSPEALIEEITYVKKKYGLRVVNFYDDTFTLNHTWLAAFLEKYNKIRIPFHCNIRADRINSGIIQSLKSAGCKTVAFGIESGNNKLRNMVLNKRISNEKILSTAMLLKKHGIRFKTYNMLGLPGETLSDAFQTVEINARIGADYPWCSVFTPYPGISEIFQTSWDLEEK